MGERILNPLSVRSVVAVFFIMSLVQCSTYSRSLMKGPYQSLNDLNSSVEAIVEGFRRASPRRLIRGRSQNGRELVSAFKVVGGTNFDDPTQAKKRAYAQIAILGDRRPYNVRVQFIVQARQNDGTYQIVGYQEKEAQQILRKIRSFVVSKSGGNDFVDEYQSL